MTAGPSIREMILQELENQTDVLLSPDFQDLSDDNPQLAAQRGECLGLAMALAILTNPYNPDVNAIRQEVMERLESKS